MSAPRGSPGPWQGVRPFGTDAGWLALRRRTYAPRSGNTASHASARPSRPCTGFPNPVRDAAGVTDGGPARRFS